MSLKYKNTFQYITYDGNAFFADVGGYLGLLLGQSVIAIYDMAVVYMASVAKSLGNHA